MEVKRTSQELDIPFSPRSCNRFRKLPQFPFWNDPSGRFISLRHPVCSQADCCWELGVFRLGDESDAFLFEELVRIFESFFIDRLEI